VPDHSSCPLPADPTADRVRLRLALRRRALGLDPRLLELVLRLPDGAIERLESGRARITPSHLYRLAGLFGVTVDWFFAEESGGQASTDGDLPPACSHPKPVAHAAPAARVQEARRFLVAYERLRSTTIRSEIRELVRMLARSSRE